MTNYTNMQNIPYYMNNPLLDYFESTGGLATGLAEEAHYTTHHPEITTKPTTQHSTKRQGPHGHDR